MKLNCRIFTWICLTLFLSNCASSPSPALVRQYWVPRNLVTPPQPDQPPTPYVHITVSAHVDLCSTTGPQDPRIIFQSQGCVGLLFDLPALPPHQQVAKAWLCLYRLDSLNPQNYKNPLIGNLNQGYTAIVPSLESVVPTIAQARVSTQNARILPGLVKSNYYLSNERHRRLARRYRRPPQWSNGQPLASPDMLLKVLGPDRRATYKELLCALLTEPVRRMTTSGRWDCFEVTAAVQRELAGDHQLLLYLTQYPDVFQLPPQGQLLAPLMQHPQPLPFQFSWASRYNNPLVAPQLLIAYRTVRSPAS